MHGEASACFKAKGNDKGTGKGKKQEGEAKGVRQGKGHHTLSFCKTLVQQPHPGPVQ